MTVVVGMGIALFSFLVMWASVPMFGRVLSEGAALYQANRDLRREIRGLNRSMADLQARRDQVNAEFKLVRRERDEAGTARDRALEAHRRARAELQAASAQLKGAQADLRQAQDSLGAAKRSLSATRTELDDKRERVTQAESQVTSAKKRLVDQKTRYTQAKQRLRQEEQRVASAARTLDQLTKYAADVNKRRIETEALVRSTRQEYDRQQARLARLTGEVEVLESRRARLSGALDASLRSTLDLRRGRITFQVGEEVTRQALPMSLSAAEAESALWQMLARAAGAAAARGARAPEGGREVFILPKQIAAASGAANGDAGAPLPTSAETQMIDEDESMTAAAQTIARAAEEVAVLVVAAANAVEGEPVAVELRTFRNRRVLKENAVVGQLTLDGTRPQAAVADALYAFLKRDVHKQLLDAGVIPPSPDARGRVDGSDEDETLVSLHGGQFLQLLDEVRRAGSSAQVVVRAARDLRAADPVALRFEVRPNSSAAIARP